MRHFVSDLIFGWFLLTNAASAVQPADFVLLGGKLVTLDPDQPGRGWDQVEQGQAEQGLALIDEGFVLWKTPGMAAAVSCAPCPSTNS